MEGGNNRISYLLAFAATIVWSGNFIVARGLNAIYTPITISFLRWLIACIVILPIALPYIKKDFKLLVGQWKLMVLLSFLGVTIFNMLIYKAAHSTTALNLSLFAITAPFYVVILNRIIFKEHLTKRQIVGFLILATGLLTLLSKGDLSVFTTLQLNKGDLLMGAAASVFATYTTLVRKKNPAIGNLSFVSSTFLIGELMLIPFFLTEQFLYSPEVNFTLQSTLQLLYIGIGPSVISFYLWNKAIVGIGSTKAATIYNTLPIFSAILAAAILKESVLPIQILSSAVIIAGVSMVIWGRNRN
ncbi:MAG: DMT family transporter [Cyclobacteriaceae bacterium]|nr:DMT family transporter [Cyclobacteriaceae bacterium]